MRSYLSVTGCVSSLRKSPGLWKIETRKVPKQDNIMLKEGNKAPDFTGTDQDGGKLKLSDYKGKRVVLWFYPKDDTPG